MSFIVIIFFGIPRFVMYGINMSYTNIPLKLFLQILSKALCVNLFSDVLYAKAILLTSPTVAAVGLTLSIPCAYIFDFIIEKSIPSPLALLGALLMIIGFILLNKTSFQNEENM